MNRNGGYVLMLAMLALLVLSGIGIFALRTTRVDLRSVGNVRLGATAEYVAETASQQAFAQMLASPAWFVQQLQLNNNTYTVPYDNTIFGEANLSTFDAFGVNNKIVPNFNTVLSRPLDVSPAGTSGYSIGSVGGTVARIRLKRIDLLSSATLNPVTSGSPTDYRTAASQVRSLVLIGPL